MRVSYVRSQVVTTNTTTVVMLAMTAKALLPENTTHAWFSLVLLFRCYGERERERERERESSSSSST